MDKTGNEKIAGKPLFWKAERIDSLVARGRIALMVQPLGIMTDHLYLLWLLGGALLIVLEFFIPGAVVIFFGFGALVTGLVVYLELITEVYVQFLFWIAASMGLALLLRQQIMRLFPSIEKDDYVDESEELAGQHVLVLETVNPDNDEGRIRFQGTSYKAQSLGGVIPKGETAEIVRRENLLFFVK